VPGENDGETGVEPNDLIFDQRHAIRADLGAPGGEQIRRRHAVARQEAVHVHRRRIAGLPGVDHGNPSSGSTHAAAGHGSAAATQRLTFVGRTAAGSCLLTLLRRGCQRLEGSEDQVESERELVAGVVSGGEERCGGFVQVGVLVGG